MRKLGKSLRSRIFLSVTFFVVIPLIAAMSVIWKKTNEQMIERQIQSYEENTLYMSRLCDGLFDDIKDKSLLIYNDQKTMEILNKGSGISEDEQKLLNGKVSAIFFSDDKIKSLTFYVEKLNLMIYRKRNESNRFYRIENEKEQESYFINPYYAEDVRYHISTVKDQVTGEYLVVLDQNIMDLNYRSLVRMEIVYGDEIFEPIFSNPAKGGADGNYVIDDDGQFLYGEFGEYFPDKIRTSLQSAPQGVSYMNEDEPYVVIKQKLADFPYDVVKCISMQVLMDELLPYRNGLILMFILIMIIIAVLALILSRLVSGSIRKFTQSIISFRNTTENVELKIEPELDEMKELAEEFSGMMHEINQLIEEKSDARYKEKKAYLMLLTMQINPHFLYNSLQTLQFMALKRKAFEMNAMLTSLGKILRYSLDWDKQQVTLEEEVENVLEYLSIQKFRYVDELDLQVDRPETGLDCMVPKMILQPLVENCFVHGFKGKTGDYKVRIDICHNNGDITVLICDNGKGMESAQMEKLNAEMEKGENYIASGHTGLLSASCRLKEKYPGAYVRIEQGQWFCVKVSIPGGYHEGSDHR